MSEDQIKEILKNSKTIAMIGVSSEKKGEDPKNLKRKPANVVMKYMQDFGYKVIPVNPFAKGEVINGETVIESLDDISEKIDIVDVFRPSKETPGFAKDAVKHGAKTLWLQYGIQNDEAKKISEEADIKYIENKNKIKINLKINNSLIIPDYEIVLKNKSKKIIDTIKEISKLEYREEKIDNVVNLKPKKDRNIFKKNNFKKKSFYKKKYYKKVTK